MAPFSKSTFVIVLSSSLLLQLFMIVDHSDAAVVSRRRSIELVGMHTCRCLRSSSKHQYQYSVVIDAGSSGSRVHVYRWPRSTAGHMASTPGVVQAMHPTLKTQLGLETVDRNLTVVRHHVEQLLINASGHIPPELHRYTPVHFMATAGIREMPTQRRDALMTFVDCLMLDTDVNPFCYDPVTGSRVLSGKEEAVFDWISVNYLLGNFVEKTNKPLVGVVEMGGASVQIAFVPAGDVTGHLFPVHVTNRRYLFYAQSYLDYGETSVVDYVKMRLEASDPASRVIHNPCMLRGDVQMTTSGKTFVGNGYPQACVDLLREHVDRLRCQSPHQCAMGGVNQPPLPEELQFYAIGAFVYTLPVIGALTSHAVFVPTIGYQKAFEFCRLTYEEALVGVSETQRKYVSQKCLAALYIPLLLNHGFGFSNDSSVIRVPGKIAGQKPGWTLGAVLHENSQIQHNCEGVKAGEDDDIRAVLSRLMTKTSREIIS